VSTKEKIWRGYLAVWWMYLMPANIVDSSPLNLSDLFMVPRARADEAGNCLSFSSTFEDSSKVLKNERLLLASKSPEVLYWS